MVNHIGFNLACIIPGVQQVLGGIAAIGYTAQIIGSLRDRVNLCGYKTLVKELEKANSEKQAEINNNWNLSDNSGLNEAYQDQPDQLEKAKKWTKIIEHYRGAEHQEKIKEKRETIITHKERIAYVKTEILKEKNSPKLIKRIKNLGIAILLAIPLVGSITAIVRIGIGIKDFKNRIRVLPPEVNENL
jgi:hypothetical protein